MFASLKFIKTIISFHNKNSNLLFVLHFVCLGRLFDDKHVLGRFEVGELTETVIMEVLQLHVIL